MTRLALSRLHHPVLTLGHGVRAGIWMQGCSVGCRGCVSQDTWAAGPQHRTEVADVLGWVAGLDELDGVTVSGGEPFDQPDALTELLSGLEAMRRQRDRPLDVLCYSGYSSSLLRRRHADLLALLDVAITGPFVADRAAALPLRGSTNQEVLLLSGLGAQRYGELDLRTPRPRMQVAATEGTLWYIGIPGPGDLERLDAMMGERGVLQGAVSWLS